MLFINLNLNLKQSRISIKLPESICKNKIELKINRDGNIIINSIYKFKIASNLIKFNFNPLTLRQFNWSKTDCFYNLNFLIDCEFEYNYLDNQCSINMPSDREMALDWAYCCGNNQEIHLKNLKSLASCLSSSTLYNKNFKSTESSLSINMNQNNPISSESITCISLNQNKSISSDTSSIIDLNQIKPTLTSRQSLEQSSNNSIDLDQIYFLFTKQKIFTKILIESTNKTEYLILKILSNRCLIAFDDEEDYLMNFENKMTCKNINTNDNTIENKLTDHYKEYKLKEAIFIEFIYLDYDKEPDNVKKYRHSFEHEFIQLDNKSFNRLFNLLFQLNKSILPLSSKFNNLNKFNYSYLVNSRSDFK